MPFILPHRHLELFALNTPCFFSTKRRNSHCSRLRCLPSSSLHFASSPFPCGIRVSFLQTSITEGNMVVQQSILRLPYQHLDLVPASWPCPLVPPRHSYCHGFHPFAQTKPEVCRLRPLSILVAVISRLVGTMPLCLHQLQDFFYPSNEPAEWQDVTYRLRHLSLSTCAPLPSMTPGLLPTTYTKVRSGRMSSVDSASPSSSCAFVQRICCAPSAFPTIEVFVLRSFVTEGTLMPSIFLIIVRFVGAVRLRLFYRWGFLSHKAA